HRQSLHLGELLCQRAFPTSARKGASPDRHARADQRRRRRRNVVRRGTSMTRGACRWIVAGGVAASLVGGCAIGPDYKRPRVAEPPTFRGQVTTEAESLADAPWWEVFQDPILKTLIQEALRNNYDARIAAARVQEARANFRVSRSDLYPSLDYGAGVSRANVTSGVAGGPGRQAPEAS